MAKTPPFYKVGLSNSAFKLHEPGHDGPVVNSSGGKSSLTFNEVQHASSGTTDFPTLESRKTTSNRRETAEIASYLPGLNIPSQLFLAGDDAISGNYKEAATNLAFALPFAKPIAKGAKLLSKAKKYLPLSKTNQKYAKGLLGKNIKNRNELEKVWKDKSTKWRSVDINDKMLSDPNFLKSASKYVDIKDKDALRKYLAVSAKETKIGNDVMKNVLGKGSNKRILYTTPNQRFAATYGGNTPGTKSYMAQIPDQTDISKFTDVELINKIKTWGSNKIPYNKFDINKAKHGTSFQMAPTTNTSKDRIMGIKNVVSKQTDPIILSGNKPLINPNKVKLKFYKNN